MTKTKITTNATINARGNVDFFCAKRELSIDVARFMYCVVRKDEVNTMYNAKIEQLKNSVDNLEKLAGSIMETQIPALKAAAFTQLEQFEAERKKLIDEQATFEYSEADKAFKKALGKGLSEDEIAEKVAEWFDRYGINVRNTYFLDEVLGTFGSKVDKKTIATSNGTKCMKYDAANALKNLYGVAYEHMVAVGTIKAQQIPELLREKYAPKKKSGKKDKKNKKSVQ